ncbi:MAG: hypothetical protein GYA41_03645 [Bacteroidales bacterium]|nr:hypothetical protein [Bacteroidales bacterium]
MKLSIKIKFFAFIYIIFFVLSGCRTDKVKDKVFIDNGIISLGFDARTGAFTDFINLTSSYNMLDGSALHESPWEIEFARPEEPLIDINSASKFTYSKSGPFVLELKWKKFAEPYEKLEVLASVTIDTGKPVSFWKIYIRNPGNDQIKQVIYPRIAGIRKAANEFLAVPQWMGQIMKDPRGCLSSIKGSVRKYEWAYPGLSMQCIAIYDPLVYGFYAACNDSLVYNKNFSVSVDSSGSLVYGMHNLPGSDSAKGSYEPAYSGVIGSFRGDWITAAEMYREWAEEQRWTRESRFTKGLTPGWLESTALWEWNRGRSSNVLTPAADLQKRLGLPVSVFWHWWHGCSYDDGFPEYVPPREGRESFIRAVSEAGHKGIRAIVYMNQRLWGTTTESWKKENASVYAVRDQNGEINTHVYNIFSNKPTASMCLGTDFWKQKYASLCDSAVNTYMANGVYMDQACLALSCYASDHGHPPGPGKYWFENFSVLSDMIRQKIKSDRHPVLAGEGAGEAWLPHLDLFLTLAVSRERYAGIDNWEVIPFFQAVYHQYAITYGNYSSLLVPPYDELWPREFAPADPLEMLDDDFNMQFLMEQARSFVWGLQPTIANYQKFLAKERKEEIDYLLNLATVRNHGLKYLLNGRFIRSPEINIPDEDLDISRLSIYAGKEGRSVTRFSGRFPLIYTGTWQATDKSVGIAVASISNEPLNLSFKINAANYGLPSSGRVNIIDHKGRRLLNSYSGNKVEIEYILKPKDLLIIEIEPYKV